MRELFDGFIGYGVTYGLKCPSCGKYALDTIEATYNPTFGLVYTYKCENCGHEENRAV